MSLHKLFQTKRGQTFVEYATIFILVGVGILVMGPYVIRSWNAKVKTLEDTTVESAQEVIVQAPLNTIPGSGPGPCTCQGWEERGCGNDLLGPGGISCQDNEMLRTRACKPAGCGPAQRIVISECVVDSRCRLENFIACDCAGPGTVEYDVQLGNGAPFRECRADTDGICSFTCNPPNQFPPFRAEYCPGDDVGLTAGDVNTQYVDPDGCTSRKCEVMCKDPFVIQSSYQDCNWVYRSEDNNAPPNRYNGRECGACTQSNEGAWCGEYVPSTNSAYRYDCRCSAAVVSPPCGCPVPGSTEILDSQGQVIGCDCAQIAPDRVYYNDGNCPQGFYPNGTFCPPTTGILLNVCAESYPSAGTATGCANCPNTTPLNDDSVMSVEHCQEVTGLYTLPLSCSFPIRIVSDLQVVSLPASCPTGYSEIGPGVDGGLDTVTGLRYCARHQDACFDNGTCVANGGVLLNAVEDLRMLKGSGLNSPPACSSLDTSTQTWQEYAFYDLIAPSPRMPPATASPGGPAIRFCVLKTNICASLPAP